MQKEPTAWLLHLARQFAAEPAGISLDEIVTRFSVSWRTAERMRDTIAEVFPQLEELAGERPKGW
jgi:predicted DNA-binding transcriptional regulator YafY